MSAAVEVEDLRKLFRVSERAPGFGAALRQLVMPRTRAVRALDGVSFRITPGERVAFVGPNGAGKSTTLKILSGILHPDGGLARVAGHVPWRERSALAHRIGTVFGQRSQLWHQLPVADSFELLMHVYDQRGPAYLRRRARLVEAFEIGQHLSKAVRQLSLGQRMRCEVVASLLHAPEVLFLDEPTIGLDVAAKATIREVIRDESRVHGRTLLLTSHDTADMEQVCERVIVIHEGRILRDESLASLRRSSIRQKRVTVRTVEAEPKVDVPGARVVRRAPHVLELEVDVTVTSIDAVLHALLRRAQLSDLTVEDPPMEEIVHAIYRGRVAARDPALEEA